MEARSVSLTLNLHTSAPVLIIALPNSSINAIWTTTRSIHRSSRLHRSRILIRTVDARCPSPRLCKSSPPFLVIVPEERPTFRQLLDYRRQRSTIRPTQNTSGRIVQSSGDGAGPTRGVSPFSETVVVVVVVVVIVVDGPRGTLALTLAKRQATFWAHENCVCGWASRQDDYEGSMTSYSRISWGFCLSARGRDRKWWWWCNGEQTRKRIAWTKKRWPAAGDDDFFRQCE
jgi:hypothetical protein